MAKRDKAEGNKWTRRLRGKKTVIAKQKKTTKMSGVNEQRSPRVRVKKVRHGICSVGIIFPHTGSPTLRQMENRKGEQGEIQLSQVSSSSNVLIVVFLHVHVCVRACVGVCGMFSHLSGPPAVLPLSGIDSSKTKKFCVC